MKKSTQYGLGAFLIFFVLLFFQAIGLIKGLLSLDFLLWISGAFIASAILGYIMKKFIDKFGKEGANYKFNFLMGLMIIILSIPLVHYICLDEYSKFLCEIGYLQYSIIGIVFLLIGLVLYVLSGSVKSLGKS